jgi:hypothetical protein
MGELNQAIGRIWGKEIEFQLDSQVQALLGRNTAVYLDSLANNTLRSTHEDEEYEAGLWSS